MNNIKFPIWKPGYVFEDDLNQIYISIGDQELTLGKEICRIYKSENETIEELEKRADEFVKTINNFYKTSNNEV